MKLQEARNFDLTLNNKIMIFINEPDVPESLKARNYFILMHTEVLSTLRRREAGVAAKEAFAIAENNDTANNVNKNRCDEEDEQRISPKGAFVFEDNGT